ncbi:uncharacterized protein LOC116847759 [Odontomachus brunneus]|uniref:uncharacterized protein LOC116847759 n=1 Tax=Odontomachus brunneus TaxID=486640 RepID=UPI0013F1966C|nr:uncharacterized protein LOC116847759 [Odontomachus brunneus]
MSRSPGSGLYGKEVWCWIRTETLSGACVQDRVAREKLMRSSTSRLIYPLGNSHALAANGIPEHPKVNFCKVQFKYTYRQTNAYPYIVLENIYVFPSSPIFFERSFQGLYEDLFFVTSRRFVKDEVFINAREEAFTNALSTVVKEFANVFFGSYPVSNCR